MPQPERKEPQMGNLAAVFGGDAETEPQEEEVSHSDTPAERVFSIRNLRTNKVRRAIPVSPGFSARDVNAFIPSLLEQLQRGEWLDTRDAYPLADRDLH